jgi:hypothetical protein
MGRSSLNLDQIKILDGEHIKDGTITVDDLNTTIPNKAVITKIEAGSNISISSTGIDNGTGVVTINSSTFTHIQSNPSNEWAINHNLGKFPSVTVVDSALSVITGDIKYIDENNIIISFSGGFSGRAYLN